MTEQHPITPPPELVKQWCSETEYATPGRVALHTISEQRLFQLLTRSAQWGYEQVNDAQLRQARDQELEACCKWTTANFGELPGQNLHLFRRPKPPSLKERAMEAAYRFYANNGHDNYNEKEIKDDFDIICRALEALPDD